MNQRFFFMRPLLDRLNQPVFFCRLLATTLRVVAVFLGLFSLAVFFRVGKHTFDLSAERAVGGVLFEVFFVLGVYACIHVLLIRARDIEEPKPADSYAIAATAVLLRLCGEAYGVLVFLVAIGGGLFVWFTGQGIGGFLDPWLRPLFPATGNDPSFIGGVEFMATGMLVGLAALTLAYTASQLLSRLVRPLRSAQSAPVQVSQGYRSRFGS